MTPGSDVGGLRRGAGARSTEAGASGLPSSPAPTGTIRRRGLPATLGAGLAAFALVGCGTGAGGLHTLVAAARVTLSRTASSTSTIDGGASFGTGRTLVYTSGAFAFPSGLGYEAASLPKGASRAARTVYLEFLANTVYLASLPGVTLPEGTRWISASLLASAPARFPRFVEQVESLNPQLVLDEISWGATAATFLGHRVTNHVPYSEYEVSISLPRALASADRRGDEAITLAIRDEMGVVADAGSARGRASVRVNAWVDGPGRVAELQAAIPGSGLGTVTTVLSSFGTPVPPSVPSRSETITISSLPPSSGSPWLFGGGT